MATEQLDVLAPQLFTDSFWIVCNALFIMTYVNACMCAHLCRHLQQIISISIVDFPISSIYAQCIGFRFDNRTFMPPLAIIGTPKLAISISLRSEFNSTLKLSSNFAKAIFTIIRPKRCAVENWKILKKIN